MRKIEVKWRERNEEGEVIEIKAIRNKRNYHFEQRFKREEWTPVPLPPLEHLEELREILELRYRRRKGSLKEVEVVEDMIRNYDRLRRRKT